MQSAADNITAIAWHIESKGMPAADKRFSDAIYTHFLDLANEKNHTPFA